MSTSGNDVLKHGRAGRGWSRRRAAVEMQRVAQARGLPPLPEIESIERSMARHERGDVRPDALYADLYCAIYGLDAQQLLGDLEPPGVDSSVEVRSHKFVMAYIGPRAVQTLCDDWPPTPGAWFECCARSAQTPGGPVVVHAWPFGVVAAHVTESATWEHLADLAMWRVTSYPHNLARFSAWLTESTGSPCEASYVLSCYWVPSPPWSGAELHTASHLLCAPKTMLDRSLEDSPAHRAAARLLERSLMRESFTHPDVRDFGVAGISTAAASWSGVAYLPHAPSRSLTEDELAACQLAVQAIWTYCDYLSRTIEHGEVPDISPQFGRAFLRRARSRLNIARPQETGQHMSMRTAIVETSGVLQLLNNAIDLLDEG